MSIHIVTNWHSISDCLLQVSARRWWNTIESMACQKNGRNKWKTIPRPPFHFLAAAGRVRGKSWGSTEGICRVPYMAPIKEIPFFFVLRAAIKANWILTAVTEFYNNLLDWLRIYVERCGTGFDLGRSSEPSKEKQITNHTTGWTGWVRCSTAVSDERCVKTATGDCTEVPGKRSIK